MDRGLKEDSREKKVDSFIGGGKEREKKMKKLERERRKRSFFFSFRKNYPTAISPFHLSPPPNLARSTSAVSGARRAVAAGTRPPPQREREKEGEIKGWGGEDKYMFNLQGRRRKKGKIMKRAKGRQRKTLPPNANNELIPRFSH